MRRFDIFGRTETGPVRRANEDRILMGRFIKNRGGLGLLLAEDDDFMAHYGLVLAVADGIGGADGGDIASKMGMSAFDTQFYSAEKTMDVWGGSMAALEAAGERANHAILDLAAKRQELAEMGCTIAGVCLTPQGTLVFHAGDSRVYRFRNSALKQLTSDDSVVGLAVQAGHITQEEAQKSPVRNTITNCLGQTTFQLHVQAGPELRDRDVLLVSSDGLHGLVDVDQLEATMSAPGTVETMANNLVDRAVQQGGNDNISVIVVRVVDDEHE